MQKIQLVPELQQIEIEQSEFELSKQFSNSSWILIRILYCDSGHLFILKINLDLWPLKCQLSLSSCIFWETL